MILSLFMQTQNRRPGAHWNLSPAVPPGAADFWQGGCCELAHGISSVVLVVVTLDAAAVAAVVVVARQHIPQKPAFAFQVA